MAGCNYLLRGLVIASLLLSPACASRRTLGSSSARPADSRTLLQQDCETQLRFLATVIDGIETERTASDPVLIEIRELYDMSRELYLRMDYSLMLSLIDDALDLVEKSGY